MADTIDTIIDNIQARLESIGVVPTRSSSRTNRLYFTAAGNPCMISCDQYRAVVCEGQSLCGEYFYTDPDFYTRLVKIVRMLVNPTSIWYISEIGSSIGMPRILDE